METINLIRHIFGCGFITLGIIIFFIEIFCVSKLHYVLDRMHFAGTGDTLAFAFTILGCIIINGIDFSSLKLVLVLTFFWFASPVSSHLISRAVMKTDPKMEEHVKVYDEEESKRFIEE
ncbi:MAG: monovalent cation/H(+) antiporter subunit G [Lachnospiraceae bacterium]|jgi:multicomponent Na+:H+ antiporter subunit G|nr:monovalent cation/H(+) antiporter subunit G [Lachnospiraceae bacterium]MBR5356322.1 monovalent cation/H(+) antiporter subunit G [Lachnospiraceae bacterium]